MSESNELIPVRVEDSIVENLRHIWHNIYITDDKKREYFETWDVPKIEFSENDSYHLTVAGEEGLKGLTLLAWKYYNRADLWWVIAAANNIFIPTEEVVPGVELRIPARLTVFTQIIT